MSRYSCQHFNPEQIVVRGKPFEDLTTTIASPFIMSVCLQTIIIVILEVLLYSLMVLDTQISRDVKNPHYYLQQDQTLLPILIGSKLITVICTFIATMLHYCALEIRSPTLKKKKKCSSPAYSAKKNEESTSLQSSALYSVSLLNKESSSKLLSLSAKPSKRMAQTNQGSSSCNMFMTF